MLWMTSCFKDSYLNLSWRGPCQDNTCTTWSTRSSQNSFLATFCTQWKDAAMVQRIPNKKRSRSGKSFLVSSIPRRSLLQVRKAALLQWWNQQRLLIRWNFNWKHEWWMIANKGHWKARRRTLCIWEWHSSHRFPRKGISLRLLKIKRIMRKKKKLKSRWRKETLTISNKISSPGSRITKCKCSNISLQFLQKKMIMISTTSMAQKPKSSNDFSSKTKKNLRQELKQSRNQKASIKFLTQKSSGMLLTYPRAFWTQPKQTKKSFAIRSSRASKRETEEW